MSKELLSSMALLSEICDDQCCDLKVGFNYFKNDPHNTERMEIAIAMALEPVRTELKELSLPKKLIKKTIKRLEKELTTIEENRFRLVCGGEFEEIDFLEKFEKEDNKKRARDTLEVIRMQEKEKRYGCNKKKAQRNSFGTTYEPHEWRS